MFVSLNSGPVPWLFCHEFATCITANHQVGYSISKMPTLVVPPSELREVCHFRRVPA